MTSEEARRLSLEAQVKANRIRNRGTPLYGNLSLDRRDIRNAEAVSRHFREVAFQLERQGK